MESTVDICGISSRYLWNQQLLNRAFVKRVSLRKEPQAKLFISKDFNHFFLIYQFSSHHKGCRGLVVSTTARNLGGPQFESRSRKFIIHFIFSLYSFWCLVISLVTRQGLPNGPPARYLMQKKCHKRGRESFGKRPYNCAQYITSPLNAEWVA